MCVRQSRVCGVCSHDVSVILHRMSQNIAHFLGGRISDSAESIKVGCVGGGSRLSHILTALQTVLAHPWLRFPYGSQH